MSEQQQFEKEIPTVKFMTNVFRGGMDQTYRVKMLKHVSGVDEVPLRNILVSLALTTALTVFVLYGALTNTVRATYMWHFWLILLFGGLVLILAFLVPSRNGTMLSMSIRYIMFIFNERLRRLSKRAGRIRSAGMHDFEEGIIYFDDGRVGVAYDVVGHLGSSTLPEIAEEARLARLNYLITKEQTTEDVLITSIKESDVRSNTDEFLRIRNKNDGKTIEDIYRRYMADTCYQYTENSMSANDFTISQTLILIDDSPNDLAKAINTLQNAVGQYSLYASCEMITSPTRLSSVLAPLLLTSRQGVIRDVRNIQERYEEAQRQAGLID